MKFGEVRFAMPGLLFYVFLECCCVFLLECAYLPICLSVYLSVCVYVCLPSGPQVVYLSCLFLI